METGPGAERHSDDELAHALEQEVAQITASIPVVRLDERREREPKPERDSAREPESARELEAAADEGEDDADWVGPPTEAISFEDLPVRRWHAGPQPTFSAWVGAAAPQPRRAPEPPQLSQPSPPVLAASVESATASPPRALSRVEPLSMVPPELALRDSQPVPLQVEEAGRQGDTVGEIETVPASTSASDGIRPANLEPEPVTAPTPIPDPDPASTTEADPIPAPPLVVPLAVAPALTASPNAGPVVTHALGPVDATPEHVDSEPHDEVDDLHRRVHAPIASPRVSPDETVLSATQPVAAPLLQPEPTDLEPSALDRRVGRAARMFWLWFAGTSSLISIGVGATLFTLGLSLRQLLVATLVGVALSFLPLGLGTLAGKWSGQPTMVVSRATFGIRGNAVPAILALATKLFWGAVLLWLAGTAAGSLAVSWGGVADRAVPTAVALLVAIMIAGVVAFYGHALVARVQSILTIASAVLLVVMIAGTWQHVDLARALAVPDALWTHVVTGAVLVFSYLGLAWAMSSAEVARYQRPTSSGGAAMLWATFGAGVPPFVLVSYGGLLAASHPGLADRLASDPVAGFVALGLPAWFPVPLLLAVGLSLISALVLTMYSAGFTLDVLGVRLGRRWSTVVAGGPIALAGIVLALTVDDLDSVIRGIPTALSVPVAAWTGLFAAETMLRERRFHAPSLLARGGVYPDWRWVNLGMLVVASAVGLGLVSSDLPWLAWEGYLFRLLGIDPEAGIGTSNIGVVVALVLGLLTPLVVGIPAVRRQEQRSM